MPLIISPHPQVEVSLRDGIHPEDSPELVKRKLRGWQLAEAINPKLDWYQAEFIDLAMTRGREHYLTHYWDEMGRVRCPAGDESGPCLCHFGVGLWHFPGAGKTATFLWLDKMLREFLVQRGDPRVERPTVIITTTSAKWQWAMSEIPKWRPDLAGSLGKIAVVDGDSSVREHLFEMIALTKPSIILMHHAQLSPQTQGIFELLQGVDTLLLGIDEEQYFKNWKSFRTIRKNALKRGAHVGITGTPQSGYPDKLHPSLHSQSPGPYLEWEDPPCKPGDACPLPEFMKRPFLRGCNGCDNWMRDENRCSKFGHEPGLREKLGIKYQYAPGVFGSFDRFKLNYCQLDAGRVIGSRNERQLHSMIYQGGYAHRITEEEVYGIRDIPIHKIEIPLTDSQKELYMKICNGLRRWFDENMEEAEEMGSSSILAMLTHARRCTTISPPAFMLAYGGHPPSWASLDNYVAYGESSKIEWAVGFAEDNVRDTPNKMIIGSEWTDALQDLLGKLQKSGFKKAQIGIMGGANDLDWKVTMNEGQGEYFAIIDGSVNPKQREAIRQCFNSDPRLKILLLTQAGYNSISLQGGLIEGATMYVTCLGVPWLPDQLEQLFKRADRRDSQHVKFSIMLPAAPGTIDEMVHGVLYGKALSAEKVIEGNFDDDTVAARLSLRDAKSIKALLGDLE